MGGGHKTGLCGQADKIPLHQRLDDLMHDVARIVGSVKIDNSRHPGL
jgi:hypothetical protein